MNKKAVELTFNTIVIIALALLVLVVISIIFMNQAGIFSKSLNPSCEERGGTCISNTKSCNEGQMTIYTKCKSTDKTIGKCCITQIS